MLEAVQFRLLAALLVFTVGAQEGVAQVIIPGIPAVIPPPSPPPPTSRPGGGGPGVPVACDAVLAACPGFPIIAGALTFAFAFAHDDPHMMTFDGRPYEMQLEGVFYLYRHTTVPIWVQAAFQQCGYATCNCAVAVRYFDEVFVIDFCIKKPSLLPATIIAKHGSGNYMSIVALGAGFLVTLPNGLKVTIVEVGPLIGSIDIVVSGNDLNKVQGLFGQYNLNPLDEFTYRDGRMDLIVDPLPIGFATSWRVPDNESLFKGKVPIDPATAYQSLNLAACNCLTPVTALVPGIAYASVLGLLPADLGANQDFFFITNVTGAIHKRSLDTSYTNWPVGWTEASALLSCGNLINGHAAVKLCVSALSGLAGATGAFNLVVDINNCARDIYLSGGTKFSLVALEGVKTRCVSQLSFFGKLTSAITNLICPNECNFNGLCKLGKCVCNKGWFGADCSVDISIPPVISYSKPSISCKPPAGTLCPAENIFGAKFSNAAPSLLKCSVLTFPTGKPQPAATAAKLVAAIYQSASIVTCPLPAPSVTSKTAVQYTHIVKVTNDGIHFSGTFSVFRSYHA